MLFFSLQLWRVVKHLSQWFGVDIFQQSYDMSELKLNVENKN